MVNTLGYRPHVDPRRELVRGQAYSGGSGEWLASLAAHSLKRHHAQRHLDG